MHTITACCRSSAGCARAHSGMKGFYRGVGALPRYSRVRRIHRRVYLAIAGAPLARVLPTQTYNIFRVFWVGAPIFIYFCWRSCCCRFIGNSESPEIRRQTILDSEKNNSHNNNEAIGVSASEMHWMERERERDTRWIDMILRVKRAVECVISSVAHLWIRTATSVACARYSVGVRT